MPAICMDRRVEAAIITAATTVSVSIAQARRWFMELETHPERYRFETHSGFGFTQGDFAQIGARKSCIGQAGFAKGGPVKNRSSKFGVLESGIIEFR